MSIQALPKDSALRLSENDDQFFVPATNPAMRMIEQVIANMADTDFPVLLVGESGVGKEAVALHLHRRSLRRAQTFTRVVCGALTPAALDKLLSDPERENGNGETPGIGTLFLDELAELAAPCQASLLQAIADGETVAQSGLLRARIMSATSLTPEDLEQALERGTLRKDLFYRLSGVCLRLPPLRERREDIPGLVEFFLHKYSSLLGRSQPSLGPQALQNLQEYSWPGNIRELENTVKRIVALGSDSEVWNLGPLVATRTPPGENAEKLSLKQTARAASRQAEKELILKVLSRTHWNRKRAAQQLQISYKALLYKLRQMGLDETGTS